MSGILYVVATPIGNLGDITVRVIETLKMVDIVACEDTRRTEKLMRHLVIRKRLLRYDEHTHTRMSPRLLQELSNGQSVALVTDAGTPGVSDPGNRLVADAVQAGIRVIPIPGATAVGAAVSVAGFGGDGYIFLGFLPKREGRAKRILREAFVLGKNMVVFESPYRLQKTLTLIEAECPNTNVVVAREMTKVYEEFIRGDIQTVRSHMMEKPSKGEFVIVIGPKNKEN